MLRALSLYVFISFSMPEAALKALLQDAPKHQAILVLNGLIEDSFVKTANKLKDLGEQSGEIQIHPELFERYQIKNVPTFLLLKDEEEVARLQGNVSLDYGLSKLHEATH